MSADNLQYTPLDEIKEIYARVNATFRSGKTRPLSYRRQQLLQLARLMQDNLLAFEDALLADLGKQRLESATSEVAPIIDFSLRAVENLEEWAKPEKPQVQPWRTSWDTTIYHVPKGVALLISPWNYPCILTFSPLIGALAAGCPVVIKPSELTPNTAALIARLVPQYLDPEAYAVVNGAIDETRALLDRRWSHIFFTGSGKVGRIVAAAAAKFTTPLTLELGGKSPVIIAPDCDLELAAKRLLYGKLQNSGQLCVSPDYVLVSRSVYSAFQDALKKAHASFFPIDPLHPDSQWSRIVNEANFKRVTNLIEETRGDIIIGGKWDKNLRIAPTIVAGVKLDDPLMEEENFGPVLPLVEVEGVDEAIEIVSSRPHPLVIYAFTNSEADKEKLVERTNSGTLVLNDTYMQLAVNEMPFGGHGDSGYGQYYDKNTYDLFTHRRSFINVPAKMEPFFALRYPPYTEEAYKTMAAGVLVKIPEA